MRQMQDEAVSVGLFPFRIIRKTKEEIVLVMTEEDDTKVDARDAVYSHLLT